MRHRCNQGFFNPSHPVPRSVCKCPYHMPAVSRYVRMPRFLVVISLVRVMQKFSSSPQIFLVFPLHSGTRILAG